MFATDCANDAEREVIMLGLGCDFLELSEGSDCVAELDATYQMQHFPLKRETYRIIGACMEVHKLIGNGFLEVVYQEALEEELKLLGIPFEREKKYAITYKGKVLRHYYIADFVINGEIILETKAQIGIHEEGASQLINYLAASKLQVGLLVNFGEKSLRYKRFVFTRK